MVANPSTRLVDRTWRRADSVAATADAPLSPPLHGHNTARRSDRPASRSYELRSFTFRGPDDIHSQSRTVEGDDCFLGVRALPGQSALISPPSSPPARAMERAASAGGPPLPLAAPGHTATPYSAPS